MWQPHAAHCRSAARGSKQVRSCGQYTYSRFHRWCQPPPPRSALQVRLDMALLCLHIWSMRQQKGSRTGPLARRIAKQFGRRLKEVRTEKKMAQDVFATALGVSRTTASNIERGSQRLYLDQVYKSAEILGVAISILLPDQRQIGRDSQVHAASDSPLTLAEERRFAKVVEQIESGQNREGHRELRHRER